MVRSVNCPHLDIPEQRLAELYTVKQGYPCAQCHLRGRNLWICLYRHCQQIGCSENDGDHGTRHFCQLPAHCLQLNLSNRRIWCYVCRNEVFLQGGAQQNATEVSTDATATAAEPTAAPTQSMAAAAERRRDSASSGDTKHTSGGVGVSTRPNTRVDSDDQSSGHNDDDDDDNDDDVNEAAAAFAAQRARFSEHSSAYEVSGLIGLKNIANTCYMNAALQALSNAPPLHGYFMECGGIVEATTELQMQRAAQQPYQSTAQHKRMVGLARSYHRLVKDMWARRPRRVAGASAVLGGRDCAGPAGTGVIVPQGILNGIRMVQSMFRGYQQHDTQEFLRCFMEQLHQELQEESPAPPADYAAFVAPELMSTSHLPHHSKPAGSCDADQRSSQCSSPTQSLSDEAEYETCDSGVSEQSSLSEENIDTHNRQHQQQQQHRDQFRRHAPAQRAHSPSAVSASSSSHHTSGTAHHHQRHQPSTEQHAADGQKTALNSDPQSPASVPAPPPPPLKRSIISDVFDGKLLSSVQCLTCDRVSTREENFQDLSLPIPGKEHLNQMHHQQQQLLGQQYGSQYGSNASLASNSSSNLYAAVGDQQLLPASAVGGWFIWRLWQWVRSYLWGPTVSLHNCLGAFFSADELKGDNMYSCDGCKKLRNGIKYSRVLQLPEMLCVHLKRFRHELSYSTKISAPVLFPLHGLDMSAYVHADCRSQVREYDLTAVICHHGTVGGGHYTCVARHPRTGRWYEYDDQLVTEVPEEAVRQAEAYVLFYRKRQAAMLDVRRQAVDLRDACAAASEPDAAAAELRFYVSRQWLNRFQTFAEPGPIDNWAQLCGHGAGLPPGRAAMRGELMVALPQPLWQFLFERFGGGPAVNHLYECAECGRAEERMRQRQRAELAAFQRYKEETTPTLYAVAMRWLREWQEFVAAPEAEARAPGPIANAAIAPIAEGAAATAQPGVVHRSVRTGSDYVQVNSMLWRYFHGVYGGGPVICMRGQPEEDEVKVVGDLEDSTEEEEEVEAGGELEETGGEDEQRSYQASECDGEEPVDESEESPQTLAYPASNGDIADEDDDEDEDEVIVEISTPVSGPPELTMRMQQRSKATPTFADDDAWNAAADAFATVDASEATAPQSARTHRRNGGGSAAGGHYAAEGGATFSVGKRDKRMRSGITANEMFGAEGKYSSTTYHLGDADDHNGPQYHSSVSPPKLVAESTTPLYLNGHHRAANGGGSGGAGEPEATTSHNTTTPTEATAAAANVDHQPPHQHTSHPTNGPPSAVPQTLNLRKAQHKMRKKQRAAAARGAHRNNSHHKQTNGQ